MAAACTSFTGTPRSRGDARAVVELRRGVQHPPVAARHLEADGAERRLDADRSRARGTRAPSPGSARRSSSSRGRGSPRALAALGRRQHGHQRARAGSSSSAPACRTRRARPRQQPVHQRPEELRVHVVDLALDRRPPARRGRPSSASPDDHAQHVRRVRRIAVAGAVADRARRASPAAARTLRVVGDEQRARRRHQLSHVPAP